jgi:hypothetical protein
VVSLRDWISAHLLTRRVTVPGRDPKKAPWEAAETLEEVGGVPTAEERARMRAMRQDCLAFPEQQRLYALAMRQASPTMQAQGMPGSGVVPVAVRASVGATERDIAWVWEHLPAGSTIYVSVRSGVTLLAPDRMPVEEAHLGAVPCLRAAALSSGATLEGNQREAEAAVTLLSVLAYGDRDALKVVVLQGVSGP